MTNMMLAPRSSASRKTRDPHVSRYAAAMTYSSYRLSDSKRIIEGNTSYLPGKDFAHGAMYDPISKALGVLATKPKPLARASASRALFRSREPTVRNDLNLSSLDPELVCPEVVTCPEVATLGLDALELGLVTFIFELTGPLAVRDSKTRASPLTHIASAPTAALPSHRIAKSRQFLNRSPMLTPPKTAVLTALCRWKTTYLACVGNVRGENVTTPFFCFFESAALELVASSSGNSAASLNNCSASVFVPSHHRVNALTMEQSSEQSTRTPRFAAARIDAMTLFVLSPGSNTYTENSTRSPLCVRFISLRIVSITMS